jgi:DNA topoisomerase IB
VTLGHALEGYAHFHLPGAVAAADDARDALVAAERAALARNIRDAVADVLSRSRTKAATRRATQEYFESWLQAGDRPVQRDLALRHRCSEASLSDAIKRIMAGLREDENLRKKVVG